MGLPYLAILNPPPFISSTSNDTFIRGYIIGLNYSSWDLAVKWRQEDLETKAKPLETLAQILLPSVVLKYSRD